MKIMIYQNKCLYLQGNYATCHQNVFRRMTKVMRHIFALLPALTALQANGQNYVKTKNYLVEDGSRFTTSIQYYDGIGRKFVSASNGVSADGKYVYTMQTYDIKGRKEQYKGHYICKHQIKKGKDILYLPL